jgi:hypothetical protein
MGRERIGERRVPDLGSHPPYTESEDNGGGPGQREPSEGPSVSTRFPSLREMGAWGRARGLGHLSKLFEGGERNLIQGRIAQDLSSLGSNGLFVLEPLLAGGTAGDVLPHLVPSVPREEI